MVHSLSLILALAGPSNPFSSPPGIAEPDRLALTPKLDGRIDAEEWDELSSSGGTVAYFQWEPQKLHAAARLPRGRTLVLTFDLKNDGWLKGRDNLEVRVKWLGDRPECKTRLLDNTPKTGPVWIDSPMFQESIACAARSEGEEWIAELTLVDPGTDSLPDRPGHRSGVRVDALPDDELETEPFLPRITAPLRFVYERGSNLPGGLRWKPEIMSRSVTPGSRFRIRMTFNGANELDLRKIDMQSEGLARENTTTISSPFPSFDNKGRAFVDYITPIPRETLDGYRLMRTTITDGQGQTAVIQTSYEIAPPVEFEGGAPGRLKASDKEQKIKCSAYARSNTNKRIEGVLRVSAPEGWQVASGDDKGFTIANPYGSVRRVFELVIPAGAKGTFPVRLHADLGGKSFAQTVWIAIE